MKRLLLLCIALVLAQIALAGHGIEHAFHDDAEACIECLALPGMQAVPKQAARFHAPPPSAISTDCAVPPAPTFALQLAFRGRAPPLLQS